MELADYLDEIVAEIIWLGNAAAPHECGGLVVFNPQTRASDWVIQLENISESPEDSCLFDLSRMEEDHRDRLAACKDPSQVWLWHTHPGGNIGPSKMDLEARVPGVNYLVVALPDGVAARY